jgi:hypothetical protein
MPGIATGISMVVFIRLRLCFSCIWILFIAKICTLFNKKSTELLNNAGAYNNELLLNANYSPKLDIV